MRKEVERRFSKADDYDAGTFGIPRRLLVGMFAIGLVEGAIGSYALTERAQIKCLARRALVVRDEVLGGFGGIQVAKPLSVTSHRSNHRRKAAAGVT